MVNEKRVNPNNAVAVITHEGQEIGRIAANAPNASDYINGPCSQYGAVNVDFIEDATYAMVDRLVRSHGKQWM